MRSASDQLRIQPRTDSWERVRKQLDAGSPSGVQPARTFRMWTVVRVAAMFCLVFSLWFLLKPGLVKDPLVQSESLQDSPAYFASYLQVSQSLEGRPAISEGDRSSRFREGFSGMNVQGDSAGSM